MKLKPLALSLLFAQPILANAGDAVFYVFEDGEAVSNIAVEVNGNKKLVKNTGFVSFDLKQGEHKVELSQYGEWVGDTNFSLASDTENAEISVEIIAGEAMADVVVYEPSSEEAKALGQFAGILSSEETAGPVTDARISVNGTEISTTTNSDGAFVLDIPRGEYDLTIAHPNYGNRELKGLHVLSGAATRVDLEMSMSGSGLIEEVVAVGSYVPQTSTTSERDATTILDAIGAEQFTRFGDSSAASALQRVSGVSISGGEFAIIRGLQGRYNSTTMNDGLIPSTDPLKREIALDIFPSAVLETIEIHKGFSPELPGDSTGGSINLVTKGMPDSEFTKLKLGMTFTSGVTGKNVVSYDGGNAITGYDDGTRELPSTVDSTTDFGKPGAFVPCNGSFCLPGQATGAQAIALGKAMPNIYAVKTKNANPDVEFSIANAKLWELGEGELGMYTAFAYKNKWENRQNAKIEDPKKGNYDYQRSKHKIDLTAYLALDYSDGNNDYSSKTTFLRKSDDVTRVQKGIDSQNGNETEEVVLQWVERQFIQQRFGGLHAFGEGDQSLEWHAAYSQTQRHEPDRRQYFYQNGTAVVAPLERRYSEMDQDSFDAKIDYKFSEVHWNDWLSSIFNVGVYGSNIDREVRVARFGFQQRSPLNTNGLTFEETLSPANFDAGIWWLDLKTAGTDSYDGIDNVSALYFSMLTTFKQNFDLVWGVRKESATQEISYIFSQNNNSEYETDELLPMLALTYRLLEDQLQLRFSWSETLSRPELIERSDSILYDPDTDEIVSGNPNLTHSMINNIDFRTEYYFNDEDSVSLALFYKDIDKPVEKTVPPQCSGANCSGYTFVNQDSANIIGIEFDGKIAYQLGDVWSGFVGGNVTLLDSEVELTPISAAAEGKERRKLQGQSDVLANLQFGFDELVYMQSFTLVANYFDDRIFKIERNGDDRIEDARLTFDFLYKWEITESFNLNAKIENIFDQKVSYSRGDDVIESYNEGTAFGLDFTWEI